MKSIHLLIAAIALSIGLSACGSSKKMSVEKEAYRRLKRELVMAHVSRKADTIRVIYPELAMFDFGKDEVKSEARTSLTHFADILKEYPVIGIVVNGYTDNVGTDEVNYDLSKRRAANAEQLLESNGVAASRMRTAGMGPQHPIRSNKSDEGRQANRRVEFLLYNAQR